MAVSCRVEEHFSMAYKIESYRVGVYAVSKTDDAVYSYYFSIIDSIDLVK